MATPSSSASTVDQLNERYTILVASALGGLGVLFFAFTIPSWLSWLASDRAGEGWRLLKCDDPGTKHQTRHQSKPVPSSSALSIVAHSRTAYNTILLPSVWLGLTVGQIIVLMLWLGINVGGVMIQSDPMSNPKRAAHIAVAQLPFVFALAAKNSLTSLLGKDYARLNFLHRFCGRMIVLCGAFHGGLYLFSPTLSVVQAGSTMRLWGMSSVGCLLLVFVSSVRPLRRLFYQSFLAIHYLGWIGFLVCVNMHAPKAVPRVWTFIALGIIGTDYIFRLVSARVRTTRIITERGNFSRLRIEGVEEGWRPGQHVRIRVRRGWLGFESHPFTIANAPSTTFMGRTRGVIIHAHATGDWTKKLRKLTYGNSGLDDFSLFSLSTPKPMVAQVAVEGPYGGLAYRDLGACENALIVAGGSGITFALSLLEDAVGRAFQERARVENIVFCWSLRDYEAMHTFSSELSRITDLASQSPSLAIWIRLHLTGDPPRSGRAKEVRGATVAFERPQLIELVRLVVNQTIGGMPKSAPCKGGIFVAGAVAALPADGKADHLQLAVPEG